MIVVYATDAPSQVRKPWALDFRTIEAVANETVLARGAMVGLTDCVWIVPGSFDASA